MIADTQQPKSEVPSIAAFARCRLAALRHNTAAHREIGRIVALMAVLFFFPLLSWWRRWNLPGSVQGYGVFVIPMALAWLWVGRYRLVLPELDTLKERFVDSSVLRFLLEEEPEKPKRTFWLLWLGGLATVVALWIGDPTLTCAAFVILVIGIIGYRHGTQALRVAVFPLTLLVAMIPIPGVVLDVVGTRIEMIPMRLATHFLQIFGAEAERSPDGNPVWISKGPGTDKRYLLYAAQTGTGVSEAGLFLLAVLWVLSLIEAPFRRKLVAFIFATLWIGLLMSLRLAFLGWLGVHDEEMVAPFRLLSILMMYVLGAVGQYIILVITKCNEFQPWVRFRRNRADRPDDASKVALSPTPPAVRFRLFRSMAFTAIAGTVAVIVAFGLVAAQPNPPLPPRVDVWHREQGAPTESNAQRDYPPGDYELYTAAGQFPVNLSVTRVSSLNSIRAPYFYLLGTDGALTSNQEALIPRTGQKLPVFAMMVAHDRADSMFILHWVQSPGGQPIPEPLDVPGKITGALVMHTPVYVCDVWATVGPGVDSGDIMVALKRFGDAVSGKIEAMK